MKISPAVRRRIFETAASIIADYKETFSCIAIEQAIPRVLKLKWNNYRCRNLKHILINEYAELFKPVDVPVGWPWWDDTVHDIPLHNRQCRITALLLMAELQ